jgi:hypothetical protein
MNQELTEEITSEISILIDSGFFDLDEVLEIIEEQFMDENISIDTVNRIISTKFNEKITEEKNWKKPTDFDMLKNCFNELSKENIVAIHNAGYTMDEGIHDAFEVFHHLQSKDIVPEGFCFYNFQDIEIAIQTNLLNIAFGDFENNENKYLEIGKKIVHVLRNNGFSVDWNEDINTRIAIDPFKWEKLFDNEEYQMEGSFNSFLNNYNKL